MKDFRGGDEFDWSDTWPDYSHDLIGQWIAKSPSREQSMAFFQACSDVLLKEDSLPADWQRYLVSLMQSASQTVLEDESARTSKLAKVLGLSAGRDLTRRDNMSTLTGYHSVGTLPRNYQGEKGCQVKEEARRDCIPSKTFFCHRPALKSIRVRVSGDALHSQTKNLSVSVEVSNGMQVWS